MGDIAYYGLYPNRAALTLGLEKVTWKMHRFRKIRSLNRWSKRNLKANLLKQSFEDGISPLDPSHFLNYSSYQVKNILCGSVFRSVCQFSSDYSSLHEEMTKKKSNLKTVSLVTTVA